MVETFSAQSYHRPRFTHGAQSIGPPSSLPSIWFSSTLLLSSRYGGSAPAFPLPQQQLPEINKARVDKGLRVEALETGHKTVLDTGELQVIDNQVDQTTGTIRLKADFPNTDLQLWPGQFVNVRLLVKTLEQVVVVPTSAVQRGPDGTFVYVVGDANKVGMRPVTLAQRMMSTP